MPGNISVLFIMELIGTAAFSCSGAMVAIKKNLDLLGIVVLGVITAVGGGMIRDVLLGIGCALFCPEVVSRSAYRDQQSVHTDPPPVFNSFEMILYLILDISWDGCRCDYRQCALLRSSAVQIRVFFDKCDYKKCGRSVMFSRASESGSITVFISASKVR